MVRSVLLLVALLGSLLANAQVATINKNINANVNNHVSGSLNVNQNVNVSGHITKESYNYNETYNHNVHEIVDVAAVKQANADQTYANIEREKWEAEKAAERKVAHKNKSAAFWNNPIAGYNRGDFVKKHYLPKKKGDVSYKFVTVNYIDGLHKESADGSSLKGTWGHIDFKFIFDGIRKNSNPINEQINSSIKMSTEEGFRHRKTNRATVAGYDGVSVVYDRVGPFGPELWVVYIGFAKDHNYTALLKMETNNGVDWSKDDNLNKDLPTIQKIYGLHNSIAADIDPFKLKIK